MGYSPWGLEESDMTEQLHFHFSLSCTGEGNTAKHWHTLVCMPEKAMATHSSTLAWKIPWTEKAGRLPSMGSQRVGPS